MRDDSDSSSELEKLRLRALGMKDWTVRVTTAKNGMEAVEAGGRITAYIDPNASGRIKDRLVDPLLVDEYGVTSIDELTDGQMAEYFAEKESG